MFAFVMFFAATGLRGVVERFFTKARAYKPRHDSLSLKHCSVLSLEQKKIIPTTIATEEKFLKIDVGCEWVSLIFFLFILSAAASSTPLKNSSDGSCMMRE